MFSFAFRSRHSSRRWLTWEFLKSEWIFTGEYLNLWNHQEFTVQELREEILFWYKQDEIRWCVSFGEKTLSEEVFGRKMQQSVRKGFLLVTLVLAAVQTVYPQSKCKITRIFRNQNHSLSLLDFCRTPGYKMGRCVSIYECDYLLSILTSKSLTQQSVAFLKLSQCDAGQITRNIPHVCCARNDDSLMLHPNAGDGIHDKFFSAPSAASSASPDDSIIYRSANSLLPKTNECGREKIENRIYSGQVSLFAVLVYVDKLLFLK